MSDIIYTDEKVKQMFEQYLGMNEQVSHHFLTENEIKENFENSGVASNIYNNDNPYSTTTAGKNLEYANLLRRNLYSNGGLNLLKFIGIQQSLLTLNPRMNYILNPIAIPGLENPNGIINTTLDSHFITYPDIVSLPENAQSPELAASIGTNLGQSEGSDFRKSQSIGDIGANLLNVLNISNANDVSIDPSKAKLIDRLKNFNNLGDSQNKGPVDNFLSMNGEGVDSYKLSTDGSIIETTTRENVEKFKRMERDQGYDFRQDYLDFGSENAHKNWETFNLKTSNQSVGVKWGNKKLHTGRFGDYQKNTNGQEVASAAGTTDSIEKTTINITPRDNFDSIQELTNDQQFPFHFEEVGDKNPSWCILPATIKSLSETITPIFNEGQNYIGRTEKPVVYGGTSRAISFTINLYVEDPKDWQVYKDRILWLSQRVYAKYNTDVSPTTGFMTIYKNAPLLRLTMGDLYYRIGGYITSLSYNWSGETGMWEKSLKGNRLPLQCEITFGFNVLHDETPNGNSQLFAFAGDL